MARSLFLLSTASQAFFLSHTPELVKASILVITVKRKDEAERILDIIGELNWKKIHVWVSQEEAADRKELIIRRIRVFLFKLRYSRFEKVYFGSYVNLLHLSLLAEYEKHAEPFLLFDGLQMLTINSSRNVNIKKSVRDYPKPYRILGFKKPEIATLTYVSPLELNVSNTDNVYVVKNSSNNEEKEYEDKTIYFIGQPLPVIGLLTLDYYLECLENIKNKYKDYKIIYFPHPRENEEMLSRIKEIFEIKKLDTVFEKHFLNTSLFSEKVISFYSTVLVNLLFFGSKSEITAVEIPGKKILIPRFGKALIPIYQYFREIKNSNFQVISLEDEKG